MENWRFINENPDYMVSDHGRVMSLKGKSKQMMSSFINANSYENLQLFNKGIYTMHLMHRLVAKAFIPNPRNLPQVNHLDGNTLNNHASNLEWCDAYDNIRHAILTGLRPRGRQSIPCATTDASGSVVHAYPSMMAMQRGEHMRATHRNWLQLYLMHPERIRFFAQHKYPTQNFPIQSPYTPVLHSVTHQYYRRLSPEEAVSFGFSYPSPRQLVNKERSIVQ